MKTTHLSLWAALASVALAVPLEFDINVRVKVEEKIIDPTGAAKIHAVASGARAAALPIVTLPYERHQASPEIKENQNYYNFSNIPFAKQPIGKLRFKAAQGYTDADKVKDPPLNDGQKTVVCPQEQVGWVPFAKNFSLQLFNPTDSLDDKWKYPITPANYTPIEKLKRIPNQDESCLVLDVFVPKRVYDPLEDGDLVPVVISFHGGGFIFGSKTIFGSPEGLLNQAGQFYKKGETEDADIIFVSINYRLGAFGWLSGDDFRNAGGFENAGLTDQLAAIQWVVDNIVKFNGDPNRITLIGESAGASSILHHVTAYGGKPPSDSEKPKWQRAILQSPGFFPRVSGPEMNDVYKAFLNAAGASNFNELIDKSPDALIEANRKTTYNSTYGQFTYGPAINQEPSKFNLVPAPPSLLLKYNMYFKSVNLMMANNRREGSLFTPPWLRTDPELKKFISSIYPQMPKEELDTFQALYNISEGVLVTEKTKFLQAAAAFGDLGVDCNVWNMRKAFDPYVSFEYYYNMYPGFHGQDVGATYWDYAGEDLNSINNAEQSQRLQRYLTSYVKFGDPNIDKLETDADFISIDGGDKLQFMYIGDGNVRVPGVKDLNYGMSATDPLPQKGQCEFWQNAPYWYPEEDSVFLQRQPNWQPEL